MMNEETAVCGLDEEYQNASTLGSKNTAVTGVGEFHLAPTPTQDEENSASRDLSSSPSAVPVPATLNPQSLEFIDSTVTSSSGVIEGQVKPDTSQFQPQDRTGWGGGTLKHRPPPGKASSYLDSKGFGWLLEVEDEEEDAKPLL